ncbi:MAG: ring-cleaving dioxygenase [Phaeodactylibacter sp.]|nr:ring-cleaving dioxygenase [Phaeodactylibacter sp.]
MTDQLIKGIHHVTATVNDAREDCDFYTQLLGQRLVKKTVNFDNNRVYHFYYGDKMGTPGTIMTTFPYKGQGVRQGAVGTGQVSITGFSAPAGSIPFWKQRLESAGVAVTELKKFGNPTLQFKDPSGLILEITGNEEDERNPWTTSEISERDAIRGFYAVTLLVAEAHSSFGFLAEEFGFARVGAEGNTTRFAAHGGGPGQYVDVREDKEAERGINGIGTVHHVAWRVESDEALLAMRRRLADELGFKVTEVKDRKYFHSIYFRMPGAVLFEIATIPPGFVVDESAENLGQSLRLPDWEEPNREQIEKGLPEIKEPDHV